MKTVKGNLISMAFNGDFDVIVHGANCFHTMGAGIAREIKNRIPEAYEVDLYTQRGAENKLGKISVTKTKQGFLVVNGYTQFKPGKNCDYTAIKQVFERLNNLKGYHNKRIGIPLIGAGIAGGNWDMIKKIIEKATPNLDITVVEYEDK